MRSLAIHRRGPLRQRGVALLTAVVLVALATIVATAIAFDTAMSVRRAGGAAAFDQALLIGQGAEGLAAYAITEQRRQSSGAVVHGEQAWARPIGPVEVAPGAQLSAQLEDLQGRFNLNNLTDAEGKRNDAAVEVFERLLAAVGLERDWATTVVDWIDDDVNPQPGGAEDTVYSSESPAYRTANRVITTPSELLALKDFGAERYAKIAPYVTALPRGSMLNVCTASGALLDALTDEKQWAQAADALQRNRAGKCFPKLTDFPSQFADPQQFPRISKALGMEESSSYFLLRTVSTIGTSEFALYSLLKYEGAGGTGARVRVIQRTFVE